MQLGESLEDYLESIYMLSMLIDPIRSVDVASHLGFSKPSVSHAIKILSEQGYVTLDELDNLPTNKVTLNTVNTYLLGMGLKSDLVSDSYIFPKTTDEIFN